MWPSESDLESLDAILDRMNPITGFPYPMKSARNEGFPQNVGDPWIGAYTKNGYWFKLVWGGEEEWKEIANEMWYRNEFLVDSKTFKLYQSFKASENQLNSENLTILCAKNIRGEVLGIALLFKNPAHDFSTIGPIFVQEDFRHVGIGSILMKNCLKNEQNVAFNAVSYLLPTVSKFSLQPKILRNFGRIRVSKPSGFDSLKEEKSGISLKFGNEITCEDDWKKVAEFGEKCTNEIRNWRAFDGHEDRSQLVAAFEEDSNSCVGISILREIHNEDGQIPDLMVSPLYAKTVQIAEILLKKTLLRHYNPEDDYDFDVDHHAIYRRSVNFFVFSDCESTVFPLLRKLAGSDGKMEKDRLTYQTCANFQLPAICHGMVFGMADPNVFLC
uniref:N-acetyltransferase domain-containing protein n=1 Tax=Caenorhabditis japonica TaxID=281687 RepID=A0A8R1DHC4_CAEJA